MSSFETVRNPPRLWKATRDTLTSKLSQGEVGEGVRIRWTYQDNPNWDDGEIPGSKVTCVDAELRSRSLFMGASPQTPGLAALEEYCITVKRRGSR